MAKNIQEKTIIGHVGIGDDKALIIRDGKPIFILTGEEVRLGDIVRSEESPLIIDKLDGSKFELKEHAQVLVEEWFLPKEHDDWAGHHESLQVESTIERSATEVIAKVYDTQEGETVIALGDLHQHQDDTFTYMPIADGSVDISDDGDADNVINAKESTHATISGTIDPTAQLTALKVTDEKGHTINIDPAHVSVDPKTGAYKVTGEDLSSLTDGKLTVTATETNATGNSSTATDTIVLDAHTSTPMTPTITVPPIGHTLTPTIVVTGTPGTTVHAIVNGHPIPSVIIPPNGHANVQVPPNVITPNTPNTITATTTSPHGNVSPQSHSSITVDTTPPTLSIDAISTDNVINAQEHGASLTITQVKQMQKILKVLQ